MYSILKIIKKVSHYWADKIQPQTENQLNMRYGSGNMPYAVIKIGK